jgi:hypothetical protein
VNGDQTVDQTGDATKEETIPSDALLVVLTEQVFNNGVSDQIRAAREAHTQVICVVSAADKQRIFAGLKCPRRF